MRRILIKGASLLMIIMLLAVPLAACARQKAETKRLTAPPLSAKSEQQSGAQKELSDANTEIDLAAREMDSLMKEIDQIDPGQDNPQGLLKVGTP